MPLDPKIRKWKGGHLRVFGVPREMEAVAEDETGETLYEPRLLEPKFLYEADAEPLGDGLAVLAPAEGSMSLPLGVELGFEFRGGRWRCVSIASTSNGPELTQTLLRQLRIDEETRTFAVTATVRLELDEAGDLIGVLLSSPRYAHDWRTRDEVESELGHTVPRPGRPPISDAELERVAEVVQEAQRSRQSTGPAVAAAFSLTLDAAKKRIRKARDRGFLPPTERRDDA